ncbi:cold-shock protein [Pseudoxanthomonas gei]|uniref:Cold-shock protein n=1 Tax=Pseudoxanthomonas gei TaxID=1383030 RepID=A0ABX0AE35_9GAMM|nr:cold shock domain-containing protein [Pseudoxanthomonas gei]NDK37433.1 cold-shock protein [Pseudoxanthomonas gei]
MRTHGTLSKWNDDRGFGFITPAGGSDELFVHVSAFPKDGQRPRLNEVISFEIEAGSDGKSRAVRVMRPGARATPRQSQRLHSPAPARGLGRALLGLLAVGALGTYGYSFLSGQITPAPADSGSRAASIPDRATMVAPAPAFSCDGRTHCSQMNSCAEATYFLQHCPGTQMDGNGDGEPCEQQWCN